MTRTFSAPLRTVSPTDFEDLSEDSSTASEPELSPVRPPEAEVTEPERPCKRAKIMGRGVRFTENVRVQEYVAVPSDLPYQLQPKRFLEPEPVDDTVSAAAAFVEPERVKLPRLLVVQHYRRAAALAVGIKHHLVVLFPFAHLHRYTLPAAQVRALDQDGDRGRLGEHLEWLAGSSAIIYKSGTGFF